MSVQLANITVYFVLQNSLQKNKNSMKDIISIKRFIDDGVGMHKMSDKNVMIGNILYVKKSQNID